MIAELKMRNIGKLDLEACISVNLPPLNLELAVHGMIINKWH